MHSQNLLSVYYVFNSTGKRYICFQQDLRNPEKKSDRCLTIGQALPIADGQPGSQVLVDGAVTARCKHRRSLGHLFEVRQFRHTAAEFGRGMANNYQRTSSAIERRNGYLTRLHHSGQGFSQQTLKVLTIIHNFHLKHPDGTTAAQRLFDYEFPDLFEWIVEHMGDLPLARRSSKSQSPDPFHLEGFPA